jgi:hypothetical protein
MTRVVVDQAVRTRLDQIKEPAELCDESGRVLGRYLPQPAVSPYQGIDPPISEEELERRDSEEGGRPLAAILADLEKQA